MKSISIDFKNNVICIMTDNQQGTEIYTHKKELFSNFIPDKHNDANSFTWNFENETFSVNQDYTLIPGAIMIKDNFIPEIIIPMPGLAKRYNEFIGVMGYHEENTKEILTNELKRFFRLNK